MKKLLLLILMLFLLLLYNGCSTKYNYNIYSIKDAYNLGLISKDDLKCLADYYNNCQKDENYNSFFVNDLGKTEIKNIKKAFFTKNIEKYYPLSNYNVVNINNYYGTYGDCIAVDITDSIRVIDVLVYEEYELDGIVFYHYTQPGLTLCVKSKN